jgi:hypothetical protein
MAESERRESTARAGRAKRTRRTATTPAPGAHEHGASPAAEPERPAPLCQVALCPICATVMLVGDLQPELVDHLLAAGREMLLAMRTIIDSRLQEPPSPPETIQRLTIT